MNPIDLAPTLTAERRPVAAGQAEPRPPRECFGHVLAVGLPSPVQPPLAAPEPELPDVATETGDEAEELPGLVASGVALPDRPAPSHGLPERAAPSPLSSAAAAAPGSPGRLDPPTEATGAAAPVGQPEGAPAAVQAAPDSSPRLPLGPETASDEPAAPAHGASPGPAQPFDAAAAKPAGKLALRRPEGEAPAAPVPPTTGDRRATSDLPAAPDSPRSAHPAAVESSGPAPASPPSTPTTASAPAAADSGGQSLSGLAAETDGSWRLVDLVEPLRNAARLGPADRTASGTPPPAVGQLAVAIRTSEADRFELRLNPPELGRVQIEMRVVEGALHAVLLTERADTGELLRRHAETLQREFQAAGYSSVSLSFGTGSRDGGRDDPRGGAEAQMFGLSGLPAPAAAGAPGSAAASGRLDIRL